MTDRPITILVLADDLTGAAEIGGIAFQHGLKVRILANFQKYEGIRENVTIIDTASRSLTPERAIRTIRELITKLDLTSYDLLFLKVDSVLRGPVIAEASAILAESVFDRILMIPANPSMKRTIRNGLYFIDGVPIDQTAFRLDPLHPRLSAKIIELLEYEGNIVTGNDPALLESGKIFIPDVGSGEDIERLVSEIYRPGILLAGGSDYFRIILSVILHLMPIRDPGLLQKPVNHHFICGSRSETSIYSVTRLAELGYTDFKLPGTAIRNDSVFTEWTDQIGNAVRCGERVVVSGPPEIAFDPIDIGSIAEKVARAAKAVAMHSGPGTHLFLEGGETASRFFREMGWDQLIVSQFHEVGVVTVHPEEADIQITIKPGSYPWPETLLE